MAPFFQIIGGSLAHQSGNRETKYLKNGVMSPDLEELELARWYQTNSERIYSTKGD